MSAGTFQIPMKVSKGILELENLVSVLEAKEHLSYAEMSDTFLQMGLYLLKTLRTHLLRRWYGLEREKSRGDPEGILITP